MPRRCARHSRPTRGARIKVMFADNQLAAEDLLRQVREAGPTGDE